MGGNTTGHQPLRDPRSIQSGHQPTGDRADISLRSNKLPGEEQIVSLVPLEGWSEQHRAVDEGVSMHLTQTHELGMLETWNHPEHALLIAPPDVGLKSHDVVECAGQVVLPQLDDGKGPAPRARVYQSHRAHGPEGQCVGASGSQHLDGKTCLKVPLCGIVLLELALEPLSRHQQLRRTKA